MKRITQDAQFRQRMMLFAEHHGVEETAIRCGPRSFIEPGNSIQLKVAKGIR